MTSGGKIILGLLAMGGITLAVFHSGKASAAPLPPPSPDDDDDALPPGSILPPAGTPIPGGGAVPAIPGLNAPASSPLPSIPLPSVPPLVVPLPASTSPFPAAPSLPSTINVPGLGPVTLPPGLPRQIDPLPTPTVTPGPALPTNAPPQSAAELPGSAPSDTLALVSSMLKTEQLPRWRVTDPLLKPWQAARRRTADGLFGTGDALVLAQEIGAIPIIRAWPKGSFPGDGKLEAYRAALLRIAATAPEPRASLLRGSAARELGQGYGTPEKPIATLITIQS
jgi:hypothetical protein